MAGQRNNFNKLGLVVHSLLGLKSKTRPLLYGGDLGIGVKLVRLS